MKKIIIILTMLMMISLVNAVDTYVYQETANGTSFSWEHSVAVPNGQCDDDGNNHDGNYATYSNSVVTGNIGSWVKCYDDETFTKPADTTNNTLVQVKAGSPVVLVNYSMPQACWDYDATYLYLRATYEELRQSQSQYTGTSRISCKTGSSTWTQIQQIATGDNSDDRYYEIAVHWNIPNNAPTISGVGISSTIYTNDSINCSFTPSDGEGDEVNVSVTWFSNISGSISHNTTYDYTLVDLALDEGNVTAPSQGSFNGATNKGEKFLCQLNITDGGEYNIYNSSWTTILNTAPSVPSGSSTNGANQTTELMTITGAGSTDDDGDSITYKYEFRCNGTSGDIIQAKSTNNNWTINSSCDSGSTVHILIYSDDGEEESSTYENLSVYIFNSPPSIDSYEFTPTPNDGSLDVTFTFNGTDAEGNQVYNWTKWYKNEVYNSSWENEFTISAANFSSGDNLTISLLIGDAYINSTWKNFTLQLDDSIAPEINSASVDSTSHILGETGYMIANCTDSGSSVESVTFYYTNPLAIDTIATVYEPYNGDLFRTSVFYNILGTWQYTNVTCNDTNGNSVTSPVVDGYITVVQQDSTPPAGGGGGGTTTPRLKECDITLNPEKLSLGNYASLREIVLENNDVESWTPVFAFDDEEGNLAQYFEITNTIGTLLPGKSDSFGIKYNPNVAETGEVVLKLQSANCAEISIPILIEEGNEALSFIDELFASNFNFVQLWQESIFSLSSSLHDSWSFATVGLLNLIFFLVILFLVRGELIKDIKDKNIVKFTLIFILTGVASVVLLIFSVSGIRLITG